MGGGPANREADDNRQTRLHAAVLRDVQNGVALGMADVAIDPGDFDQRRQDERRTCVERDAELLDALEKRRFVRVKFLRQRVSNLAELGLLTQLRDQLGILLTEIGLLLARSRSRNMSFAILPPIGAPVAATQERLPSRLIPHRHCSRAELQPAHELQVEYFDSPANNVGPWPASLGCTTNSYSSINPSSANASGSVTPPTNSPLPAPLTPA
jgi:hypothetical protein